MSVNWPNWLLWGFVATLVLTTMEAASQGLRLSRISIPFMVGTMVTPNRDKAKLYGFLLHVLNGWAFSLLYVLAFQSMHRATWWIGVLIGIAHALFVLTVVLSLMPGLHPRMASEQFGPTARRQLEPPGFLGLNYGGRTPLSVLLSHIVFGAMLGAFYTLK